MDKIIEEGEEKFYPVFQIIYEFEEGEWFYYNYERNNNESNKISN